MEHNDITIINLSGKEYALKLTNGVLKRFCASKKMGINELEQALNRYDIMLDLVYMMVLKEAPTMTQKEFDEAVEDVPIMDVLNSCASAFASAFNTGEEAGTADPT